MGVQRAEQLCRQYGGRRLPTLVKYLGKVREACITRDLQRGYSIPEIALKYAVTQKKVRWLQTRDKKARKRVERLVGVPSSPDARKL
jgi:hypothetical protein